MAAPVVTVTNLDYLLSLLRLGLIWREHLHLRVTVQRAQAADSGGAPEVVHVTFAAVPREQLAAFPPAPNWEADPNHEYFYSSEVPAQRRWVALTHMIDQRGQPGIFGPDYHTIPSLVDRCAAMGDDYDAGKPVAVFLTDLHVGDEFGCDGADVDGLAAGWVEVCRLADRVMAYPGGPPTLVDTAAEPPTPVALADESPVVVHDHQWDRSQITWTAGAADAPPPPSTAEAQAAAEALLVASFPRRDDIVIDRGAPDSLPLAPAPATAHNVYGWEYPVSALGHRPTAEEDRGIPYGSPAAQEVHRRLTTPAQLAAAAGPYARLARVAIAAAAARTKAWAAAGGAEGGGGIPPDRLLRYLADYVGRREAVLFAAVEATGGVQRGVAHLSYSAWTAGDERDPAGDDVRSVAATVGWLRNAGRLGFDDNVLAPVGGAGGVPRRLIVPAAGGGGWMTTVSFAEAGVVAGRLDDDAEVR